MIAPKIRITEDLRNFLFESSENKEKNTTHKNAFTKPKKLTFMAINMEAYLWVKSWHELMFCKSTNNNVMKKFVSSEDESAIVVFNATVLIQDCEEEVERINGKREHDYKVNKNASIGAMKDDMIKIFMEENEQRLHLLLKRMKDRFIRHLEPVRLNRSFIRKYKR